MNNILLTLLGIVLISIQSVAIYHTIQTHYALLNYKYSVSYSDSYINKMATRWSVLIAIFFIIILLVGVYIINRA